MTDLFGDTQTISLEQSQLIYTPNFLGAEEAQLLFDEIVSHTPWEQKNIQIFGKMHKTPRLTAWYGDNGAYYRYSNLTHKPRPWTPLLHSLKLLVEEKTQQQFNSVLVNYYRDGKDSVGWHSDDETELGDNPVIASLSLGATRTFSIKSSDKHKAKRAKPLHLLLESGSLLLMRGNMQQLYHHQVPKDANCHQGRINLTFRYIYPGNDKN